MYPINLIIIIILFMIISANGLAEEVPKERSMGLRIHTVDKNNSPFKVETLRWWHAGNVKTVRQLECKNGPCSEWVLEENVDGSIQLYATFSNMLEDNGQCWEVYTGNLVVDMPAREATIVMAYANKVCKSDANES